MEILSNVQKHAVLAHCGQHRIPTILYQEHTAVPMPKAKNTQNGPSLYLVAFLQPQHHELPKLLPNPQNLKWAAFPHVEISRFEHERVPEGEVSLNLWVSVAQVGQIGSWQFCQPSNLALEAELVKPLKAGSLEEVVQDSETNGQGSVEYLKAKLTELVEKPLEMFGQLVKMTGQLQDALGQQREGN